MRLRRLCAQFTAALSVLFGASADAGEVAIAVAANFADAAREIVAGFEAASGHETVLSFGSTGQLYVQISQGAPFDVLLAADRARPGLAVEEGLAIAASRFTYATGQLALYSTDPALIEGPQTLGNARFTRLAIANPVSAPYGAAALETLAALGLDGTLDARLVRGNSIAQTYQFVATGNAELGFVALSQIAGHADGSRWIVPGDLHAPIAQDAVLLTRAAGNEAAHAFMDYLRGPEARAIIAGFGYAPGG